MPTKTRCLLCSRKLLDHQTFAQVVNHDELCDDCRRSLKLKKRILELDELKLTAFYLYDEMVSDCLIQYKECMDEALKDIFLFEVKDWIALHYRNCAFLCAPSLKKDRERRGFQHVVCLFESCGIEIVECFEKSGNISQKKLSGTNRREIEHSLTVHEHLIPKNKRLVLIDDVATTGSTLLAMQKLAGKQRCKEALCIAVHPKLVSEFDRKRRKKSIYCLCRKGGRQ